MDKIIVKGLRLFAFHGVNAEEKENGQPFVLDVEAYLPLELPCATDELADTVSYSAILKTARAAFLAEKYELLERAAQAVADALLDGFPQIESVKVAVKKPFAPILADFDYMAVEIKRKRNGGG